MTSSLAFSQSSLVLRSVKSRSSGLALSWTAFVPSELGGRCCAGSALLPHAFLFLGVGPCPPFLGLARHLSRQGPLEPAASLVGIAPRPGLII